MAYTQLRIAVLLLSCFVFFTHLVYGAPIQMANNAWKFTTNLEPLPSQTENSQLKFSTDEIQDASHKVRDISSTVSPEMMTNATFAQMTTSVELVAIDDQYNTTDLTTITPSSEAASTKNLIESTDQPLQVTEKQNIISESSSVINQINATSQTSSNPPDANLSTSKDLITSQSTNIMTLTTTSETITEKTTKEQDKVTKATDATISTTIESFAFHPIVVPDDINTSQNTEIPLVTAETPTDPTKDTIDKSTEFAVVDDLKGTTAFVSTVTVTVPMTESHKSTIAEDFSSLTQTLSSLSHSQTTNSEQISTAKTNEINESPKTSDFFSSSQTLASMADASQTTNYEQILTTKMYEKNESPQTSEIFSSSQTLASMADASQTTKSEQISTAKTSDMNESPKTSDFFSSFQTSPSMADASKITNSEQISTTKMNESPKTSDLFSSFQTLASMADASQTTNSEQISTTKMYERNESPQTSEIFSSSQTLASMTDASQTTNSEQISTAKTSEMNESPKTLDFFFSSQTLASITDASQTTDSEHVSTPKMNELNESPTQLLVSDSTLRASELSYIPVETIVSDVFNMTSPNQSLKEFHLWSSPEPDRTINVSSETAITTATNENPTSELPEKLDINEITEVSKATQSPVHSEQTKLMSTDALTNKNFEKNEIDKSTTLYVPIRKDYTSLLRRKTNPMTEAPSHQNIVTEQTPKTSKKHLNVWVADLKVPDGDVDFTSIPRNPTSTMYPTLMNVNLPATAANSVVSRRAGYLNNIPPIQQDVEKLPSSTNPVRASNPSLTDTFPNHSILDISSTIPAYSSTTFFDQFNVVTTPISSTTRDTHTTPAQENDRKMQNTSLNSDDSQVLPKNVTAELTKLIEKDVLPLSPSLIQQMRLVDDAIKEEFMKEMALSLNKKIASLNKTTRDNANNEYLFTTTTGPNNISEKSKNLTLYKVNPNYKPLKRLEIQPSKQFTIDPDDNSWRNESINSRGVVFKANNSTIVFSQVLKNKTEAELNNTKLWNKDSKEEQPELRERLEKLAEKRKYKKKYNTSSIFTDEVEDLTTTEQPEPIELKPVNKISRPSSTTIDIPTFNKDDEAYESNDDDEEQLSKLSHLDLLKSSPNPIEPVASYFPPNRKGTIQYFPPRKSVDQIKYNINFFATENNVPVSTVTVANDDALTTSPPKIEPPKGRKSLEPYDPKWRKEPESEIEEPPQGAYIIKHYRDFLRHATGDIGYERKGLEDYNPHSEVLNKIVEDLNNNSEQFKVEFPVLYNTSIEHGGSAASRTYVRRLHEPRSRETRPGSYLAHTKRYDPSCENLTVELNPAYELHYYVPDQEERQDPAPVEAYHFDNL